MGRMAAKTIAVAMIALAAACGDGPGDMARPRDDRVTAVVVSPSTLALQTGDKLRLSAIVAAGPDQTDRRVRWSGQNPLVATVDNGGLVSALGPGVTNITAASAADTTVTGSAVVVVAGFGPSITIASINHNGAPVDLTNAFGTLDVVVNIDGSSPLISRADVVMNSGGADSVVATYRPSTNTAGLEGVTLTFNTVGLRNGQWTLKVPVTLSSGAVIVSSTVALKINNP